VSEQDEWLAHLVFEEHTYTDSEEHVSERQDRSR
jgi:hypothetical protein